MPFPRAKGGFAVVLALVLAAGGGARGQEAEPTAGFALPANRMVTLPPRITPRVSDGFSASHLRVTPDSHPELGEKLSLNAVSRVVYDGEGLPDLSHRESMHFINTLEGGWEMDQAGRLRWRFADRTTVFEDPARDEQLARVPELHLLHWQWRPSGSLLGLTLGRQRMSLDGRTSLGSAAWLPDRQVFDALRVDAGRPGRGNHLTAALVNHTEFRSPYFTGPDPAAASRPLLMLGTGLELGSAGRLDLYQMAALNGAGGYAPGLRWNEARTDDPSAARHSVDFAATPLGDDSSSAGWQAVAHRYQGDTAYHVGVEHLPARGEGPRISVIPGTWRYLGGGPHAEANNFFLGADRQLTREWVGSLILQGLAGTEGEGVLGHALDFGLRHFDASGARCLIGFGVGHREDQAHTLFRAGVQFSRPL